MLRCVLIGVVLASGGVAVADEFAGSVIHNAPEDRHLSVEVQVGTTYSTTFQLPIAVIARYAVLDRIYVDGIASVSPIGDVKAVEVGAGGTLCALSWTGKGRVLLSASPVSTKWVMVPEAGRHCLGIGGGVLVQRYAVDAVDMTPASSGTVFYSATAPILHAGLHKLLRQDVRISDSGGTEYGELATKKIFLEAMYAPTVSADLPAMATEPTYRKWGGRIGIDHAYGDGTTGWSYRAEAGAFPGGGKTMRVYAMLSVGVSFGL